MNGRPHHLFGYGVLRLARRNSFALRLAGCFCAVLLPTVLVGLEDSGRLIWVANGLLLSYLLVAPRWRWPEYFAVAFAAEFVGGLVLKPGNWDSYLILTSLNLMEVAIGAFLLRKRNNDLPQFTDRKYLLRFIGFAVLLAPLVVGVIFAVTFAVWTKKSPWQEMLSWVTTDSLGTAIATPACVALFRSNLKVGSNWKSKWVWPIVLLVVTVASFSQTHEPVVFLIYPVVSMILFRSGLGWASMSTLAVAAIGSWCTVHGLGPFARTGSGGRIGEAVLLQLFIASGMFMIYAASSVMERLRSTRRRLQEIVSLHNLVTENSRDAILIVDFDGYPRYVSSALERMTGWTPEEMKRLGGSGVCHPDDREHLESLARTFRQGAQEAIVEYRVLKPNGEFIWVEASLRPCKDPVTGIAMGTLNIIREITQRKRVEADLRSAYVALEALAVTDPLTHVANRRRFEEGLSMEWRRCERERHPLSMLLIDVDWFKSYNDTYGHLCGDSCLQQIAESAQDVVTRAGDLLARIGGEEFAVLLPGTSREGAVEVAEQICQALRRRKLPHSSNPLGYVTVSVGCATMIPGAGQDSAALIQKADEAMYAAKRNGRDQIYTACDEVAGCKGKGRLITI